MKTFQNDRYDIDMTDGTFGDVYTYGFNAWADADDDIFDYCLDIDEGTLDRILSRARWNAMVEYPKAEFGGVWGVY